MWRQNREYETSETSDSETSDNSDSEISENLDSERDLDSVIYEAATTTQRRYDEERRTTEKEDFANATSFLVDHINEENDVMGDPVVGACSHYLD